MFVLGTLVVGAIIIAIWIAKGEKNNHWHEDDLP